MATIQKTDSNKLGEMNEPKVNPSPSKEADSPSTQSPASEATAETDPDVFPISNWRLVLMTIGILLTYLTVCDVILPRCPVRMLTCIGWNRRVDCLYVHITSSKASEIIAALTGML